MNAVNRDAEIRLQDRPGLDTTVMVAFRMSLIKMNSENKIDEVPITQAVGPVI